MTKRGFDGLDHDGVLPNFTGIAVHDGFKPYRNLALEGIQPRVGQVIHRVGRVEPHNGVKITATHDLKPLPRQLHQVVGRGLLGHRALSIADRCFRQASERALSLAQCGKRPDTLPTGGVIPGRDPVLEQ
jgi:hypothetical protein